MTRIGYFLRSLSLLSAITLLLPCQSTSDLQTPLSHFDVPATASQPGTVGVGLKMNNGTGNTKLAEDRTSIKLQNSIKHRGDQNREGRSHARISWGSSHVDTAVARISQRVVELSDTTLSVSESALAGSRNKEKLDHLQLHLKLRKESPHTDKPKGVESLPSYLEVGDEVSVVTPSPPPASPQRAGIIGGNQDRVDSLQRNHGSSPEIGGRSHSIMLRGQEETKAITGEQSRERVAEPTHRLPDALSPDVEEMQQLKDELADISGKISLLRESIHQVRTVMTDEAEEHSRQCLPEAVLVDTWVASDLERSDPLMWSEESYLTPSTDADADRLSSNQGLRWPLSHDKGVRLLPLPENLHNNLIYKSGSPVQPSAGSELLARHGALAQFIAAVPTRIRQAWTDAAPILQQTLAAALIVIGKVWTAAWLKMRQAWTDAAPILQQTLAATLIAIGNAWTVARLKMSQAWADAAPILKQTLAATLIVIGKAWAAAWLKMRQAWADAAKLLQQTLAATLIVIGQVWAAAWLTACQLWTEASPIIRKVFAQATQGCKQFSATASPMLREQWAQVTPVIRNAYLEAKQGCSKLAAVSSPIVRQVWAEATPIILKASAEATQGYNQLSTGFGRWVEAHSDVKVIVLFGAAFVVQWITLAGMMPRHRQTYLVGIV